MARDGSGDPIIVTKGCSTCGEWRCKTHCRCGRLKQATGRKAARPGSPTPAAKAQAAPKAAPKAAAAKAAPKAAAKAAPKAAAKAAPQAAAKAASAASRPPPPVRTLPTQVSVLSEWHKQLLAEVKQTSTKAVRLLSYCMDEAQLCDALQKRLGDKSSGFRCTVVVDKQYFLSRTATHQRPRLKELVKHGAVVMLASGKQCGSYRGQMHMKVAAINDDVVFVGSCNWTFSALANQEICLRLQGPAAQEIQKVVSDVVKTAVLLRDDQ